MGWADKLKGLLGGHAKPAPRKAVSSKGYNPPSDRAALLAEAMEIHQRERVHAQGVLERTLKDLIAKPPKPQRYHGHEAAPVAAPGGAGDEAGDNP